MEWGGLGGIGVLRTDDGEASLIWRGAGMQGQGEAGDPREVSPTSDIREPPRLESVREQTDTARLAAGAMVAERLACSPPTKASRVQYPAGSLRIFACGNLAGRCRWSACFLGDLPPPLPFHSGCAPYTPLFSALKTSLLRVTKISPLHEIPGKNSRPAASSSTIRTCEIPGVPPFGIEPCSPRWEASSLASTPPWTLTIDRDKPRAETTAAQPINIKRARRTFHCFGSARCEIFEFSRAPNMPNCRRLKGNGCRKLAEILLLNVPFLHGNFCCLPHVPPPPGKEGERDKESDSGTRVMAAVVTAKRERAKGSCGKQRKCFTQWLPRLRNNVEVGSYSTVRLVGRGTWDERVRLRSPPARDRLGIGATNARRYEFKISGSGTHCIENVTRVCLGPYSARRLVYDVKPKGACAERGGAAVNRCPRIRQGAGLIPHPHILILVYHGLPKSRQANDGAITYRIRRPIPSSCLLL
ncbi:hypothetical protein PR048_014248 [Dryococelus australis]|uniref:Uncharacterized protein n=1 Tax=Dryococelus australis TaxID=614101 RepID=A0ABQ9HDT4_9NEOP|nr:hypothetical protein PR048_014248 [Dryococelus australis]